MWSEIRKLFQEMQLIYGLDRKFSLEVKYLTNKIYVKIKSDLLPKKLILKSFNEEDLIKEVKNILLKESITLSKEYKPTSLLISFGKSMNTDLLKIYKNETKHQNKIITICENFREKVFKEELGCYNCFELIDSFNKVELSSDLKKIFNPEIFDNTCVFSDDQNIVAWDWSRGDGTLYFKIKDKEYINYDCKKSSTWERIK